MMMMVPSIAFKVERRRAALWSQRRRILTVVVERRPSDDELYGTHDLVRLEGEARDEASGELTYRVLRVAGVELELFAPVCGIVSVGTGGADGCQAGHLVKLTKFDADAPYWTSLSAPSGAKDHAAFATRIDWSRWVDEDDEDKDDGDEDADNRADNPYWQPEEGGRYGYGDDDDADQDDEDDEDQDDEDDEDQEDEEEEDEDEEEDEEAEARDQDEEDVDGRVIG